MLAPIRIAKPSSIGSPTRTIRKAKSMPRSNHRDRRKTGDAERKHANVLISRIVHFSPSKVTQDN